MQPIPTGALRAAYLASLFGAASAGCYPDSVAPGYYGSADDAGAPGTAATASTALDPGSSGTASTPPSSDGGSGSTGGVATDAGPTTTVGCDLSGRWLATDREVATGLGAEEASHIWFYFELGQTGSSGTVTRGLNCGQSVVGISAVAADIDYHKTWPAMLAKDLQTGRKFTSTAASGGCAVSFEKRYDVVGSTVPFYLDPSQALPMVAEEATSTTPGWEDWDNDGNPGFTMNVTGLATGQIYITFRHWAMWSGTIATGASTFQLADDWDSEQDLLGYNGSSLLSDVTAGVRDSDATLHFVAFARLSATQATGDDTTACASVRSLAASLTPSAQN